MVNKIQDGCVWDAATALNAYTNSLVSINKINIANWSAGVVSSWIDNNIYGRAWSCCACQITPDLTSCGLISNAGCGLILCQTNYTDCFASTGCMTAISPTQYLGTLVCSHGGCPSTLYACVCTAGTLSLCTASGSGFAGATDCIIVTNTNRIYADCYRFCFCVVNVGSCVLNCSDGSSCSCVSFGGCVLYQCNINNCSTTVTKNLALYEFRKIPNTTNCYCYLCDSVFICCFTPLSTACSLSAFVKSTGGCNSAGNTKIEFKEITMCFTTSRYPQITCNFSYTTKPNFLVLSKIRLDTGTDVPCVDLLCCDGTCLMNMPFNCAVDVSSYPICTYRLSFYNCCIPSNCNSCPVCLGGWAISCLQ